MKKFILIICLLLSSMCYAKDFGIINNKRGLVFQSLNGGALGYICPKLALSNDDCRYGQFVYFDFNYDFVDNQRFTLPENYYFYADGVYRYTNKNNEIRTVRKISITQK